MALLCLAGCTQTEAYDDENRTIFAIDPTKGSPFNNGRFEGWGTSQDENWAELPEISVQQDMLRTTLAPYSITTFVIDNVTIP